MYRDRKKGKKQINFGLLCDKEGRPVGVEVFSGSVADPGTLTRQLDKLKHRFGFGRVTLVADRGLLTQARLSPTFLPNQSPSARPPLPLPCSSPDAYA